MKVRSATACKVGMRLGNRDNIRAHIMRRKSMFDTEKVYQFEKPDSVGYR